MRTLYGYAGVAVGLVAALPFVRTAEIRPELWAVLVGLVSAGAIFLGLRRSRPAVPRVWVLIAVAQLCVVLGGTIALEASGTAKAEWVAWAGDAVALAASAVLVVALVLAIKARGLRADSVALMDAGILTAAAAAVGWVLVIEPSLRSDAISGAAKAVSIAYPISAVVLLGLGACLVSRLPAGLVGPLLVVGAVVAQLGAEELRVVSVLHEWGPGTLLPLWLVGSLLWGAAALHPSMTGLTEPAALHSADLSRRGLGVLAVATVAAPAMIVVDAFAHPAGRMLIVTTVTAAVLFGLVLARLAGVVFGYERSIRREYVLRAGAASLVAARGRDDIARIAAQTTLELAGGAKEVYVDLRFGTTPPTDLKDAEVLGGGRYGDWLRGELRGAGTLARPGQARTIVIPIVVKDRHAAVLHVAGPRPLGYDVRQALETLASQIALSLESIELGEDLLERRSEARFRSLIQNSRDLIAVVEDDLTIRFVSQSAYTMLGYTPDDLVGSRLDALLHPDEVDETVTVLAAGAERHDAAEQEFRVRHRDGRWRTVEGVMTDLRDDKSVRGIVLTAHDVTERRQLEDQLTHQAFHDALTGLPNRALFTNRVTHALTRAARSGRSVTVMFIDVDDFKTVNDSIGHDAGDEMLIAIGERLRGCLRSTDTPARLGGDEFALLLEETDTVEGASEVASRVLGALSPPLVVEGTEIVARASIGVAIGSRGNSASDLLRNADVAMYRAKGQGGHRFELFQAAMREAALNRLELKSDLERAIGARELELHYQPIVELSSGAIGSVEALLRWTHPTRGPIPPFEFVSLAEDTGLILELGEWVLREATTRVRSWQETIPTHRRLNACVNISGRQLMNPGFVGAVTRIIGETRIDPNDLVLEITESTLMDDIELVVRRLGELKSLGVRIAIDDFGTGFSSLSYLQRFPVDILKIAKPFVDEVVDDPRLARLVQATVKLAGSLDLETVAEGIEHVEQGECLREMGCRFGQGYLYARPMAAGQLPGLLRGTLEVVA